MLLILSSIGPKIRTFVTIRSGYHRAITGPSSGHPLMGLGVDRAFGARSQNSRLNQSWNRRSRKIQPKQHQKPAREPNAERRPPCRPGERRRGRARSSRSGPTQGQSRDHTQRHPSLKLKALSSQSNEMLRLLCRMPTHAACRRVPQRAQKPLPDSPNGQNCTNGQN